MGIAINEAVEIWDSAKEELKKVVPEASYPWIMPLEAAGFENDKLTLITFESIGGI